MIVGIGIDIVELERMRAIADKRQQSFVMRILGTDELEDWQQIEHQGRKVEYLAGRFAAKEALSKAFGTGIGQVTFKEMEIVKHANGKPYVQLTGRAKAIAEENGVTDIWITISHSRTYAVAQAILEKK